jgi:hypothetical protein
VPAKYDATVLSPSKIPELPILIVVAEGLVNPPLLVTEILFVPVVAPVYVNVAVPIPEIEAELGVNVPPAPLSLGVTTTVPLTKPSEPTVKFDDAFPIVLVVGPVNVIAVAGDESVVTVTVFEITWFDAESV